MSTLEQEKSAPFLFCHYVKSFFTVGCLIYIYVSDCFWELDLNPFLKVKVSFFVWYHLTHQICLLNYTLLSTFAPFCFKLAHIQLPIVTHTSGSNIVTFYTFVLVKQFCPNGEWILYEIWRGWNPIQKINEDDIDSR